jgi:HSF-type DNA-binding
MVLPPRKEKPNPNAGLRLNKFVRRLHDMLASETESGVVEWRRGLLVLHNTNIFSKQILPKYFNTRNFKTFRRQLNYYGFVHVRSFSNTGSSTTALWVNRELAQATSTKGTHSDDISYVLTLKRVEPCESAKTVEGRRVRKELAMSTVEGDLGVTAKTILRQQICSIAAVPHDGRTTSSANEMHGAVNQQPHKVVLEHRNYNTSTSSSLILPASKFAPLEVHQTSRHSTLIRSDSSSDSSVATPKPPSSSASVANLLLLLSKV